MSLAAISVSADLLELWFLGDLLGIFCDSEEFVFFFGVDVFLSLICVCGIFSFVVLLSLGVLDGMRYCG